MKTVTLDREQAQKIILDMGWEHEDFLVFWSRAAGPKTCAQHYSTLTIEQARAWLIENDPEGAEYWRGLETDLDAWRVAVADNIRDFSDEPTCSGVTIATGGSHG